MGDTRVGGASYEAIVATLEQISEAVGLLDRADDQRAAQIASLEAAHARLSADVLTLAKQLRAAQDALLETLALVRDGAGASREPS
jgi:outer membrane murein-binding lipoprotein Lpp